MKKLIRGIVDFRKNLSDEYRTLFAKLALGQKPDSLFIACSDSRVVPNLFASSNPGDLFVLRNVGNLIPPYSSQPHDVSIPAALEFSVFSLKVSDIIVCGHSNCGAIESLIEGIPCQGCQNLTSWLQYGKGALEKLKQHPPCNPLLSFHNQVSQMNVLQQMEHVASYPFVQERLENKSLRIHGWWFDIAQADVYCYEPSINRFVLIDEEEGDLILDRLAK